MKKIIIISALVILFIVLKIYAVYYYIYSKMTFAFSGFSFINTEQLTTEESESKLGFGFTKLDDLAENMVVNLTLKNNVGINARIKKLNLKVVDGFDNEVGRIKTIDVITIPKNDEAILSLQLEDIKTVKVLKDFISGGVNEYEYIVSGWLGGLFPVRHKAKIKTTK